MDERRRRLLDSIQSSAASLPLAMPEAMPRLQAPDVESMVPTVQDVLSQTAQRVRSGLSDLTPQIQAKEAAAKQGLLQAYQPVRPSMQQSFLDGLFSIAPALVARAIVGGNYDAQIAGAAAQGAQGLAEQRAAEQLNQQKGMLAQAELDQQVADALRKAHQDAAIQEMKTQGALDTARIGFEGRKYAADAAAESRENAAEISAQGDIELAQLNDRLKNTDSKAMLDPVFAKTLEEKGGLPPGSLLGKTVGFAEKVLGLSGKAVGIETKEAKKSPASEAYIRTVSEATGIAPEQLAAMKPEEVENALERIPQVKKWQADAAARRAKEESDKVAKEGESALYGVELLPEVKQQVASGGVAPTLDDTTKRNLAAYISASENIADGYKVLKSILNNNGGTPPTSGNDLDAYSTIRSYLFNEFRVLTNSGASLTGIEQNLLEAEIIPEFYSKGFLRDKVLNIDVAEAVLQRQKNLAAKVENRLKPLGRTLDPKIYTIAGGGAAPQQQTQTGAPTLAQFNGDATAYKEAYKQWRRGGGTQ